MKNDFHTFFKLTLDSATRPSIYFLLFLSSLLLFSACDSSTDTNSNKQGKWTDFPPFPKTTKHYINEQFTLAELMDSLQTEAKDIRIFVSKSELELHIKKDTTRIKSYPIVLGGNPVDDKRREGDSRTPEGHFKVQDKYPHKNWEKFIWVNYPTSDSWRKHKASKAAGEIPEEATVGSEIGIHGGTSEWSMKKKRHWTAGCISLTNDDINDFYPFIRKGTTIEIVH